MLRGVHQVRIKQGVVHVAAEREYEAQFQAEALERDLSRKHPEWTEITRRNTEISPGVFALGTLAKETLGVECFHPSDSQ